MLVLLLVNAGSTWAQLSGTKTIPGNYASLTAAFADLAAQGMSGPVVLELQVGYAPTATETTSGITYSYSGATATNTVTIRPAAGATNLTIASAAAQTFNISGGKYLVLDGRPGGTGTALELTVANTSTSGVAIQFTSDANNNIVQYCQVKGVNTSITGGVITFTSTATAGGNSNNTIQNNRISDGATTPNNLIYSVGSATTTAANRANSVLNNELFNFFNAGASSSAINLANTNPNGNTGWSISGNSIYQTVARTYTTSALHYGIIIGTGAGYTVTGNFIGGTAAFAASGTFTLTSTVATRFAGIQGTFTAGAASSIQGNTVRRISLTTSSGAATGSGVLAGIYVAGAGDAQVGTTTANTIGDATLANGLSATPSNNGGTVVGISTAASGTVSISNNSVNGLSAAGSTISIAPLTVGIMLGAGTPTVAGNTISGNQVAGAQGTLYGILGGTASNYATTVSATNNTITNNTIPNTTGSTSSSVYGYYNLGSSTAETLTGNTITGLAIGGAGTATGHTVRGININTGSTDVQVITGNTIGGLAISGSGSGAVGGINLATGGATGTSIARNKIYDLSASGASGSALGIAIGGGGTYPINNNLIGDLRTPAATGTTAIAGLNITGATAVNAYYNTIYLNATSTGATFGTSGIFANTTTTVDLRNNIVVNTSTAKGAALTAAYRRSSTTLTTYATGSNNNLFYAGTPAATQVVFNDGTSSDQTLAAYKTRVSSRDAVSITENPPFASTTGTASSFLHINPAVATQVESGGQSISGITTDYDGDTRNSPSDIGADEGTFTVNDLTPPTISFTPLATTPSTADRTLTATITDAGSGVAPATVLLYYRKAGGSYAATAGTLASGTAANGTYTFTLPVSTLGLTGGNTVEYYVVAQDVAGNSAVSTSTGGSAAGSGPPATPAAYVIQITYSGNYTIPTDFPTLTGAGGLFDQLNNNVVGGNLTVSIAANLTEPGTVALNQFAAGYTLAIQPDGTTERLISGSYASSGTASLNGLIRLNGADNVTFTGTDNGKYLRFRNTGSAPVFLLLNGANNNTLTYATVEGTFVNSAAGTITLDGSTANSGNTFAYNDVRDRSDAASTVSLNGFYASGTNQATTIKGNAIRNFSGAGIFVASSAVGDGWVVGGSTAADGNRIYQEASRTTAIIGIQLQAGNGHTIRYNSVYQAAGTLSAAFTGIALAGGGTGHTVSDNTIGGAAADASGTPLTSTAAVTGISLAVGGTLASGSTTVQGNLVRNITASTTAGAVTGITATAGAVNIGPATGTTGGNTIGDATATLGLTASATSYGINLTSAAATANVRYNTITNLMLSSTTSGSTATANASLYGILASGANNSAHTISYNTISNIRALDGTTKSKGITLRGIQTSGAAATPVLEGNQISNLLNYSVINTSPAFSTSTIGILVSSTGLTTVRANQISAVQSLSTAASSGVVNNGVTGLSVSGAGAGSLTTGNRIWNVLASSVSTGSVADVVNGLQIAGAASVTVANNQVSLPAGTNGQSGLISGMLDVGTGTVGYYYNSVYLAAGDGLGNTFAFQRNGTSAVTLRNNIFYNERTVTSGTAVANYAIGNTNGAATGWAAGASNYNLLVTADNAKVSNWLGTGSDLAGWKAASAGDANSYYYLPTAPEVGGAAAGLFNAPLAGDLAIKLSFATVVSPIESGGIALAGTVDNDYQGDIRQGSPGYAGTGTAPDLGSDEYAGTPAPALAFACSGVAVTQTTTNVYAGTTNQVVLRVALAVTGTVGTLSATSFSFNAGGTTGSGTPSNITNAKFYFTGSSSTFAATTAFGATVAAPTFAPDFTFTGNQALQTGTNYFFLTYDVPAGATGDVVDGVLTGVTVGAISCPVPATTGDPAGSRTVLGPLFGDYTVGRTGLGTNRSGAAGEDFASLKLALADLGLRGLRTNAGDTGVRLLLTNNAATTGSYDAASGGETFPLTIGAVAGSSAARRVVIRPQTGVVAAISGSDAKAILLLDGADYVTIDGSNAAGTDRSLTISNTSASSSSTVIYGQTASSGTNPATLNTLQNLNVVGSGPTQTLMGIGFGSTTPGLTSLGTGNNGNQVLNNSIRAVQAGIYSQGATLANKNTSTIIVGNDLSSASPANVGRFGIYVGFEDGIVISQNLVGGISFNTDAAGIDVGAVSSISNASPTGNQVVNATISRNNVSGVVASGASSAVGILVAGAATGTNTVVNNQISGVTSNSTVNDVTVGLYLGGISGSTTNVYFNTVSLTGDRGAGTTSPSLALAIGAAATVNVRDNILVNTQTTAGTGSSYAIGLNYTAYTALASDYNDLYTSGANARFATVNGYTSTTNTTLAQWRTTTGKDANSISNDPIFAGATLLPTACALDGAGVSIIDPLTATNYLDYANTLRSTPPDLGALEFVPTPTNDLQLLALTAPTGTACRSTAEPLSVQLRNNGCAQTFSAGNPLTITVSVTRPDATVVPVTISVTTGSLAAGATTTYSASFDMTDAGTYSLTPTLAYAGDQTASNNSTAAVTAVSTNPVLTTTPVPAQCGPTNSFSISAANSSNQTFVGTVSGSVSPNVTIPDNSTTGVSSAITLATVGTAAISSGSTVQVTLNINHTYVGDLRIFLVDPSNTRTLELIDQKGSSGHNFTNTVLRTGAATSISTVAAADAPFTGTYAPEKTTGQAANATYTTLYSLPTGVLNGASINGAWKLWLFDVVSGDAGTLANWSLSITDAGIPTPFTTTIAGPGTVGAVSYSGTNNANATAPVTNAPVGTNTYTITTTDPSGCAKTVTQQVIVRPLPTFSTTQTNVSCFGGNSGSIAVTAAGGTAPYSYSIDNGANYVSSATNPYTFTGLAPGTYQVLVRGQFCAAAVQSVTITGPASATAVTTTETDETAAGANDGTVTATGNGGTSPYQYSLDGTNFVPATATAGAYTFTGVMAGSYTVTVRDANACTATTTVAVGTAACTATTYTGAAPGDGSNWFNPANWTACVPSRTVDALVPAGLANYPNLSTTATAEVRNLTLYNGAQLAQSAGLLNVYGNLTSNTPTANATLTGGAVAFVGSVAQNLDGAQPLSFFQLSVNKADTLHVNTNQTVANALVLTNGILKTYVLASSHKISLTGSATIAETSTSFVLGDVEVPAADLSTDNSTSSFSGLGLTLTAHALKTDNATPAALPGLTTVMRSTGTPLYGVTPAGGTRSRSIRRRFTITPVNDTNLNVDMVFGYNNSAFELNNISETSLRLFSAPALAGPFAYAGGTPNTTAHTVSRTDLDHLSVWTLGDAEAPLPVELSSFVAERQGTNAALAWTTASEKNNRGFAVQVSTDGRSFRELGFVAGAGSGTAPHAYSFLDQEASKAGLRYYRLRQLDLDGTATFSPVRTVTFGPAEAPALRLTAAPNPFRQSLTLTVDVPLGTAFTPAQLTLTDAAGRSLLKQGTASLLPGTNKVELLELASLASGVYFVHLALPGQPAQHLKVVKE
ncbi:hypothetical protein GCM10028822_20030 [Hymenobacter terrigena]